MRRHQASGLTTIELVVVLSLFSFILTSLVGLHLVALSAGRLAETSSIATNLARARLEALLALPPDQLRAQHDTEQHLQMPREMGKVYTVRTTVTPVDPAQVDVVVTTSWQLTVGTACAQGPNGHCAGTPATYTRTLQTRAEAPAQP